MSIPSRLRNSPEAVGKASRRTAMELPPTYAVNGSGVRRRVVRAVAASASNDHPVPRRRLPPLVRAIAMSTDAEAVAVLQSRALPTTYASPVRCQFRPGTNCSQRPVYRQHGVAVAGIPRRRRASPGRSLGSCRPRARCATVWASHRPGRAAQEIRAFQAGPRSRGSRRSAGHGGAIAAAGVVKVGVAQRP